METPEKLPEPLDRQTTPDERANGRLDGNVPCHPDENRSAVTADNAAEPRPPSLPLRRADQVAIAVLALFALAAISVYWFSQAKLRGRLIDIDRTERPTAAFRIDINSADWPELIELPGLGETLAKRIVAWRTKHGRFNTVDQLRQVSGVGPKRLESWRQYLLPIVPIVDQANLPRRQLND